MGRGAKATRLKRRPVTKFVRPSTENGLLGHHGPHAVQIVCNFAEEIAIIPNRSTAEGIAKATHWPNKIAQTECANVSNIFLIKWMICLSQNNHNSVSFSFCSRIKHDYDVRNWASYGSSVIIIGRHRFDVMHRLSGGLRYLLSSGANHCENFTQEEHSSFRLHPNSGGWRYVMHLFLTWGLV